MSNLSQLPCPGQNPLLQLQRQAPAPPSPLCARGSQPASRPTPRETSTGLARRRQPTEWRSGQGAASASSVLCSQWRGLTGYHNREVTTRGETGRGVVSDADAAVDDDDDDDDDVCVCVCVCVCVEGGGRQTDRKTEMMTMVLLCHTSIKI